MLIFPRVIDGTTVFKLKTKHDSEAEKYHWFLSSFVAPTSYKQEESDTKIIPLVQKRLAFSVEDLRDILDILEDWVGIACDCLWNRNI